jgi:hypothetical protein
MHMEMLYTPAIPYLILFVCDGLPFDVTLMCIWVLWGSVVSVQYITGQKIIAKDIGIYITLLHSPCIYHAHEDALHRPDSLFDTVCMRRATI